MIIKDLHLSDFMWGLFRETFVIFFHLWKIWLPLVGVVIIIGIFKFVIPDLFNIFLARRRFKKGEAWRNDNDLLKWLRGMSPTEFEQYIATLFSQLGYRTQAVGKSHDGGIDVEIEKNSQIGYIQCKKYYNSHNVGVSAVRDFYGAIVGKFVSEKSYFITTNKFTLEAEKFAEDKPIELVDSFKLIKYIRLADKRQFDGAKCPECGAILIEKEGKFGRFIGCTGYPKCHYTRALNDK